MSQVIKLNNLSKTYGDRLIINGLSTEIIDNDFVLIKGKSGCGKTTLLNILSFQDFKYFGEYILLGTNVKKFRPDQINYRRNKFFGFVYQNYQLIKNRTALDNILLPYLYANENVNREWLKEIVEILDISDLLNREINYLSGGEQQRIAIARALIMKPRIVFLDEPFSNLDNDNKQNLIKKLKEISLLPNTTIVLVSHDIPDTLLENATVIIDMEKDDAEVKRNIPKYSF